MRQKWNPQLSIFHTMATHEIAKELAAISQVLDDNPQVVELAYKDPSVSMVIVDRLIPRKAFHMPNMIDPTPEIIEFLNDRGHEKPTVFTVDAEGGDPDLTAKGATLRAQFCNVDTRISIDEKSSKGSFPS